MIGKVAALGAGAMGAQIAGHMANAGLQAFLLDIFVRHGVRGSVTAPRYLEPPVPLVEARALPQARRRCDASITPELLRAFRLRRRRL